MLQSIREGVGRWIAIAIMALIAVTFIFWGVDFSLTGTTFAAKVNGTDIPLLEFDRELQNQQAQYQDLYRVELTDELQSELRRSVLERLIMYESLLQHVNDSGYRVSDDRVIAAVRQRPEFQIGGEFSLDVFRATLLNAGLTEQGFIEREREQLAQRELQAGIMTSGFYTAEEYTRYVELYNQRREISYAIFAADDFIDGTTIDEAAIAAHYEANKAAYYSDESVDVEYIEIQGADIAETIEVTEEELAQYYEDEQYRFQTEEERQARHILLSPDTEDPETAVADILARLDAGEEFGNLAAELSEDAGTSGLGGDLGWVARGLLVGPFEDALFEMEVGGVEGPVETDFGYHIIRLEDIRAGEVQTFDQVRDELAQDFQTSRASEQFYDLASELADRSFDAFNELASVATEMDLPLQTLDRLTRSGDSTAFP
ncbi:MAG: SurA N-terminal domain-containing protein, partial [Gammaproteobacteria bacterium]